MKSSAAERPSGAGGSRDASSGSSTPSRQPSSASSAATISVCQVTSPAAICARISARPPL